MLTAAYHMLRSGVEHADLGPDYFDRHDVNKAIHRLLERLADLRYNVAAARWPPIQARGSPN